MKINNVDSNKVEKNICIKIIQLIPADVFNDIIGFCRYEIVFKNIFDGYNYLKWMRNKNENK